MTRSLFAAVAAVAVSLAMTVSPAVSQEGLRDHRGAKPGKPGKPPRPSSKPGAGARSIGDRLFPQIGNGGYDVRHYAIDLRYDPASNRLEPGTHVDITAVATQNLSRFKPHFVRD